MFNFLREILADVAKNRVVLSLKRLIKLSNEGVGEERLEAELQFLLKQAASAQEKSRGTGHRISGYDLVAVCNESLREEKTDLGNAEVLVGRFYRLIQQQVQG